MSKKKKMLLFGTKGPERPEKHSDMAKYVHTVQHTVCIMCSHKHTHMHKMRVGLHRCTI